MDDLKLYVISDRYIQYLSDTVDPRVFHNVDPKYKHTRKYIGIVLSINSYNYYAPLSSPKSTDYEFDDTGNQIIRKSVIPIIRMTEGKIDGTKELLGTIKLNGMIPVPASELSLYDVDGEPDTTYRDLVNKEIRYINRHTPEIIKSARVLYNQKAKNLPIGYLKSTFDFWSLEAAHDLFQP